jgi:hypothetical protein
MALTKNDLDQIGKQTKDIVHEVLTDFYQNLFKVEFASKEDLKGFATKKDLEKFATKKDLEKFATKKDLEKLRDEVVTGQDKIFKELQEMSDERLVLYHRVYEEHEPKLQDHDKRISAIETIAL